MHKVRVYMYSTRSSTRRANDHELQVLLCSVTGSADHPTLSFVVPCFYNTGRRECCSSVDECLGIEDGQPLVQQSHTTKGALVKVSSSTPGSSIA